MWIWRQDLAWRLAACLLKLSVRRGNRTTLTSDSPFRMKVFLLAALLSAATAQPIPVSTSPAALSVTTVSLHSSGLGSIPHLHRRGKWSPWVQRDQELPGCKGLGSQAASGDLGQRTNTRVLCQLSLNNPRMYKWLKVVLKHIQPHL